MSTMEGAQAAETVEGRETDTRHAPDTWSFVFWSGAVLVAAMALPAANWTDDLGAVPLIAAAGLGLGALLVLSRFRAATAFMLAAGYGVALILWQMTETLDPAMAWRERVFDLVARITNFLSVVLAGQPSRDSLMFVLAMSLVFWTMAVFGTWWLFRRGGLWLAFLLPGVAVFLNVYYYRYGTRLQIYLPVFLLLALAAVVHLELSRRGRLGGAARSGLDRRLVAGDASGDRGGAAAHRRRLDDSADPRRGIRTGHRHHRLAIAVQ
jgi:hypothetical protein